MTFSKEQVAELEKKLDPANIKSRSQGGQKLSYIEGWHAEAEANRIFGFDGWTSEIIRMEQNCQPTQNQRGNHVVSFRALVRVTAGGCVRDGVGFGSGISADIHSAYESAIKEAATDAEKRALKTFGNQFGLALYDKTMSNVGVEEQGSQSNGPDWKAISNDLWNRVNECEDYGSLMVIQDEIAQQWQDAPGSWMDTVYAEIETKASQLKDGVIEKKPYQFSGTTDAWNWFVSNGSTLSAIKSLDAAIEWETKNSHYVEGLSLLDKAEKYKKDGKNPRERIAAQLTHLKGVYHQQPKTNGAAAH